MKSNTNAKVQVPVILMWVIAILLVWLVGNSLFVNWELSNQSANEAAYAGSSDQLAAAAKALSATSTPIFSLGPYVHITGTSTSAGFKVGHIDGVHTDGCHICGFKICCKFVLPGKK